MFPLPAAVALTFASAPVEPVVVRAAVEKALPLLAKGAAGHVEQRTCFGCHNQAFPALALTAARARGFTVDADALAAQAEHISAFLETNVEQYRQGKGTGGQADTAGYALFTLAALGHAPDETTAAVAEYLLKYQADRDHWRTTSNRPPSEASSFTTTFLAARGLNAFATEDQKGRVAKKLKQVRAWLLTAEAADTEDRVFRLLTLKEVGADPLFVRAAADDLAKRQRTDGGWAQKAGMASDAYATGSVLVTLHEAGGMRADDPRYRRGVAFLVRTQRSDGSWYVKSRSKPFQPYYESGFPHGADQFISVTASGWATAALALSLPPR